MGGGQEAGTEGREGKTLVRNWGVFFKSSPEDLFIDFERKRKGEREKHQYERETLISCLLYVLRSGIEPST